MSLNTILSLSLFALAAFLMLRQFLRARQVRQCTAAEAAEKMKTSAPLLLDVRMPAELRRGRIAGALNIPLHELKPRLGELEKYRAAEIIVYCASGQRSLTATHWLQKQGFNTVNLRGGWSAWRALKQA